MASNDARSSRGENFGMEALATDNECYRKKHGWYLIMSTIPFSFGYHSPQYIAMYRFVFRPNPLLAVSLRLHKLLGTLVEGRKRLEVALEEDVFAHVPDGVFDLVTRVLPGRHREDLVKFLQGQSYQGTLTRLSSKYQRHANLCSPLVSGMKRSTRNHRATHHAAYQPKAPCGWNAVSK